jgi:hypothetical protein
MMAGVGDGVIVFWEQEELSSIQIRAVTAIVGLFKYFI